jgi:tetratricopeptide (TPR) repeat protein
MIKQKIHTESSEDEESKMTEKVPAKDLAKFLIHLISEENFEKALDIISKVHAQDLPWLMTLEGVCHFNLGDPEKARAILEKVAYIEASDLIASESVLLHLSMVLENLGEYEKALKTLQNLLEYYPDSYKAWDLLGRVQARMGDLDGAERSFRRSTTIKPDWANAWDNLAILRKKKGERYSMEEPLRRYVELKPECPDAENRFAVLVSIYIEKGDYVMAERYVRKAIQHHPKSSAAWYHFHTLLKESGSDEAARKAFEKAERFYFEENPPDSE